jgi:GT2 family glycosyltransferase
VKPIVAVIVLYKMSATASPSYRTLTQLLQRREDSGRQRIDLTVMDNSPEPQSPPPESVGRYLHDGSNPGLAKRYNHMLAEAEAVGATWLLVLDQDTTLTASYLAEIDELSERLAGRDNVVAIVPKLITQGLLASPHLPSYRRVEYSIDLNSRGVASGMIRVYNSGALLRVKALRAIGGFPETYWLDYLDHATFHQLQARGGAIYVMDARLEHEMSIHRTDRQNDPAHPGRHRNQLAAEIRFYNEYGCLEEHARHRIDLAHRALRALRAGLIAESGRLLRALLAARSYNPR